MATLRLSLTVRTLVALLLAITFVAFTSVAAVADDHPVAPTLGITPLGIDGSWFELELEAGETANVSVELANHGDDEAEVATYPADVYTLINGGMGVRLRGEPITATAAWLDYGADTVSLRSDGAVARTVTVTVPDQTPPGQYIAALVVENDQPLPADGSLSLDRVVRQAIAVNVTVPGPAQPALTLGGAVHHSTGGRTLVQLEIDNPGNRHLKPAGELTVTDVVGTIVASRQVAMDSFYAGTDSHLELPLDEPLEPGTYTLHAALADADHGIEVTGDATFQVLPPANRPNPVERAISGARDLATDRGIWLPAALLAAAVAGLTLLLRRRRRRATDPGHLPIEAPTAAHVETTASLPPPQAALPPPPPPPPPAAPRPTTPTEPEAGFLLFPPPAPGRPPATATPPPPTRPVTHAPPAPPPSRAPVGDQEPVPAISGTSGEADIDPSFFTARPPARRRQRAHRRG